MNALVWSALAVCIALSILILLEGATLIGLRGLEARFSGEAHLDENRPAIAFAFAGSSPSRRVSLSPSYRHAGLTPLKQRLKVWYTEVQRLD